MSRSLLFSVDKRVQLDLWSLSIGLRDLSAIVPILQQVSRLAVQCLAERVECAEPDTLGLAGLQNRQVHRRKPDLLGQFGGSHLPPGQHHIDIYYYRHEDYFSEFSS